jgi:transposase
VEIVPGATAAAATGEPALLVIGARRRRKSGIIEIELGGGRLVRVDRDVDVEVLRLALDVLGQR